MSGPVTWDSYGLGDAAKLGMANVLAKLGEIGTVAQIVKDVGDPVSSWSSVLTPDISIEYLVPLMATAASVLPARSFAQVQAIHAEEITREATTDLQWSWARSTALDIL